MYNQGQIHEEKDTQDDDDDDDGSGFGLDLSWLNPFARFKTDNLLRKHTLIPVGSREKIEE